MAENLNVDKYKKDLPQIIFMFEKSRAELMLFEGDIKRLTGSLCILRYVLTHDKKRLEEAKRYFDEADGCGVQTGSQRKSLGELELRYR